MSKTETVTCDECFGRYKPETCPKCNGTGIVTTGEVVGTPLPRWPEVRPIREECSACGGTGFFDARHYDRFCPTCEGTGTAPKGNSPENPESSPKPALDSRATLTDDGAKGIGIRNNVEPWTPAAAIERLNATIAEQAAEIERLRESLFLQQQRYPDNAATEIADLLAWRSNAEEALRGAIEKDERQAAEIERLKRIEGQYQELREQMVRAADESQALTAERDAYTVRVKSLTDEYLEIRDRLDVIGSERDTLRLEVQRLNDLSFEAQDRYAALEAERDALRGELDTAIASRDAAGLINSRQRWKDRADLLASEIAEVRVRWQEDRKERVALGGELRIASEDRDAANARVDELRAERDALKDRVDGLERLHGEWADGSLAELTAERDALRLAVDHLKAERDELKGKLDVQQEFIDDYRKTIDRLRTEVERLKGDIEELTIQRDALKAKLKDAETVATLAADRKRLLDEATARAEKYLRVIRAKDAEIAAMAEGWKASLRTGVAMVEAGLGFRHVSVRAGCAEKADG